MRLVIFTVLFFSVNLAAFPQTTDTAFNNRLSVYLQANMNLDFEKIMTFIHPKIFQLAPKDKMIEGMKQAFENDRMKIELDSMKVEKISPAFIHGKSSYRKIDYSMVMDLTMVASENMNDTSFIKTMNEGLGRSFNGTSVYHPDTKKFHIKGKNLMIAIKDATKPWMFIGHRKDRKMLEFLFPKAVIQKFGLM